MGYTMSQPPDIDVPPLQGDYNTLTMTSSRTLSTDLSFFLIGVDPVQPKISTVKLPK